MPRYHLLALTNAVAGQEAEFGRWYDEQHLTDVLAVPGVVSAQRFETLEGMQTPLQWRFLTLYTLETDNPVGVLKELGNRIGTPLMPMTPAMDMNSAGAAILCAVGEIRRASPN